MPSATLEHLTGPSRGQVALLAAPSLAVSLGRDRVLTICPPDRDPGAGRPLASIGVEDGAHVIEAAPGEDIWVNRRKTGKAALHHGDVIEFGEDGPISRYRVVSSDHPVHRTVDDIFRDSIAYMGSSRKPLVRRASWAMGDFGRRMLWETTLVFRITVLVALVLLAVSVIRLGQRSDTLEVAALAERARLDGVASAVVRARDEALHPGDLAMLRQELDARLTSNAERLEALESASDATGRVIAQSLRSVAFLQGAYGMRHVESGRMLRYVLGPDGIPLQTGTGRPLLSLEGDGPVAEVAFTGTGFVLKAQALLVTNRHVALPWEMDAGGTGAAPDGMEPVILKFIAYFPRETAPVELSLLATSDTADLAVLSLSEVPENAVGLELSPREPRAGDEVVLLGFPTGLRSMIAQSGPEFLAELQQSGDVDFWIVAERLAAAGMIVPLASRGIVGQVAAEAVVYDAETTHGGSGGPVLDAAGRVIAINTAILPEYGGSNLGLPVAKLRALLDSLPAEAADKR